MALVALKHASHCTQEFTENARRLVAGALFVPRYSLTGYFRRDEDQLGPRIRDFAPISAASIG